MLVETPVLMMPAADGGPGLIAGMRRRIRTGIYQGTTDNFADGKLKAGLIVIPRSRARDFRRFCQLNPKACPLVAIARIGCPTIPVLGDIDVRTDVPRYDIYNRGVLSSRRTDILDIWRDDLAAFALGSSSTFEYALIEKGIVLRGRFATAPRFRTLVETESVGPFAGRVIVSMRPAPREAVDAVRAITSRFPQAHGAPIHVGDPRAIGIDDLMLPDWGEPVEMRRGEVPVFWASSMTARDAVNSACLDLAITHTLGHALITDLSARENAGIFKVF